MIREWFVYATPRIEKDKPQQNKIVTGPFLSVHKAADFVGAERPTSQFKNVNIYSKVHLRDKKYWLP